ncbi:MAG: tripartite tricarboxylate transporter substrate binding protein [Candidatus Hydrogenedentes bacterium]|nr:tripartite tricarboxylate transporter substrate binding protein [Candidatus Hydrogenedentota bacterium]
MKTAVKAALVSALALFFCSDAIAQEYPSKPIRMVVPFPAGGVVDYVARQVSQRMSESMGQTIVVENRAGASGALATEAVASSPADGYTLLVVFDSHVVNPHILKNLRYDIFKDLQSVSLVAQIPLALMTYPKFPADTVSDLLREAKTRSLNYGTPGAGTSGHLAMEQLKLLANVDMLHVPFRGGAPLMTALLGEQVQLGVAAPGAFMSNIRDGKLKAIAVTGKQRSPALPDVPTMAEAGFPALDSGAWIGLLVPAGTPQAVVNKLNKEVVMAVRHPEVRKLLLEQTVESVGSTPEEFDQFLRAEYKKWGKVVSDAQLNLKP